MIYAIVGRPRSGKSYESVVYHIIPAVKSGRKVITNIPLNIDKFREVFGDEAAALVTVVDGKLNDYGSLDRPFAKFTDYQDDWRDDNNRGPLFVVDEAHMVLPNRNLDAHILEFYSLHGHYGIDIILLTQDLRKIHRDVKAMIEITYYCAKNTAFGSDKTYTKKVRIGSTTEVVNEEQRKYKSHYFPFYQSHTQSSGSVKEATAADIKPIWTRWPFWLGGAFCVIAVIFNVYVWMPDDEPSVPEQQPILETQSTSSSTTASVPDGVPSSTTAPKENSSTFGPLAAYQFVVTGYSKQHVYGASFNGDSFLNQDLSFFRIYIDVYKDDKKLFAMNQIDFQSMGYGFNALAECVYELSWGSELRVLTCLDGEDVQSKPDNVFDSLPTVSI
ncbi:zonular occludens toxin domain-containing protein [Vibrio sp. PID23_8]|uniref:zonular occludens toxin domain-containing protein n=1 Tax=Vibrio sp. PID23_8 TaxID=1583767 RepID=UPI000E690234|nr:zonular occludens toxin domain-containing protein [Vibrio sp. PID23_8]RIZ55152.1 assembly protein [Vibrio sp. PID23_8]